MAFIVQQAYLAQPSRMRGKFAILATGLLFFGALLSPDAAIARETEQNEAASCIDPKHRHYAVRPLTEPTPFRKKEKLRVRRVLM